MDWSGKSEKEIRYSFREMWARGKAFFGMDSVLPTVHKQIVKKKLRRNDSR